MFFGDKKKIGSHPGMTKIVIKGDVPDDYDEMLVAASEEILEAVEAKDPEMFKLGLKNFIEICKNHEEKSEEDY